MVNQGFECGIEEEVVDLMLSHKFHDVLNKWN